MGLPALWEAVWIVGSQPPLGDSHTLGQKNQISEGLPWRRSRHVCGSSRQTWDLVGIRERQLSTQSKDTFQTGRTAHM